MADPSAELTRLRQEIDAIDEQIVALLNRRAEVARRIGAAKREAGRAIYAPEREREIYERLARLNAGPFPADALRNVYREIISASLALEEPVKVAFFGPRATFTHQAAVQQFGSSAQYVPARTIAEVFDEVERGRAQFGVVPIENSTEGVVTHTLDMFIDSSLKICAEILLVVHHDLLNLSGRIEDVQKVYSHPQALAQCRGWLEKHLPGVPTIDVASTATAAQMAAEDPSAAAVASELAGVLYNLKPVQRRIQDHLNNVTRFLVIGTQSPERSSADKTSLLLSIKDEVGILHRILGCFASRGINLTKIESRPTRKRAWDYVFFLDVEGHLSDPPLAAAFEELRHHTQFVKILGSYPRGQI
ncbi:MAG TPA: prephenate dehydratase [Thermodesulfobacteriota bacterium]|nr:prephenate dehydratase [Thermodesulfobacteriota bacterium]